MKFAKIEVCIKCKHKELIVVPTKPLIDLTWGDIKNWSKQLAKAHTKQHSCTNAQRFG
jgi:hypothetical protein